MVRLKQVTLLPTKDCVATEVVDLTDVFDVVVQLKQKQAEEAAARDAEASAKAEARIKAALDANRSILLKRRQDFDAKQAENEQRRM